jgi:hypothetical protein
MSKQEIGIVRVQLTDSVASYFNPTTHNLRVVDNSKTNSVLYNEIIDLDSIEVKLTDYVNYLNNKFKKSLNG